VAPRSRLRHKRKRRLAREFLREFCVIQCCFIMFGGAKFNGRHAVSCWINYTYLLNVGTHNAEVEGSRQYDRSWMTSNQTATECGARLGNSSIPA